ncbi:MAG: cache domain-containing protein, partial [Alicyclobacillus shizuokensis]|nr:cache domain-containing protein [Alicyclobacillus shizuokensis]
MTYLSSLIKTAMHSMLTRRYLLVTLMISLSVLVAIYCIALQVVYSSVEQQIEYRDNLMSETLSRVLTLKIENIISDLKLLSGYGLSTSDDQREFYIEQMQKDVVDVPLYTSIQLFDKHGHVILNAPFTSKRRYIPFPNINYRLSWSKTYFISQLLRLPDGSYTIAVAYPTISSNGSYEGGAIAYINLNVLSQELDDYTIGAQGENLVVDGNGRIIADSSSKEMAASISQTDIGQNLAKYRYGIIRTDLFHNKVVATYRPLDVADFGLIVSEPVVQATAPVAHVAKLLSEGFIIILLLASVLTVVGTTRVVKPILDLTRQADEYR